jgi:hypothetical protein
LFLFPFFWKRKEHVCMYACKCFCKAHLSCKHATNDAETTHSLPLPNLHLPLPFLSRLHHGDKSNLFMNVRSVVLRGKQGSVFVNDVLGEVFLTHIFTQNLPNLT